MMILEAKDRIGGRVWRNEKDFSMPISLGAGWIHGMVGNPMIRLADQFNCKYGITNMSSAQVYYGDRLFTPSEYKKLYDKVPVSSILKYNNATSHFCIAVNTSQKMRFSYDIVATFSVANYV